MVRDLLAPEENGGARVSSEQLSLRPIAMTDFEVALSKFRPSTVAGSLLEKLKSWNGAFGDDGKEIDSGRPNMYM